MSRREIGVTEISEHFEKFPEEMEKMRRDSNLVDDRNVQSNPN